MIFSHLDTAVTLGFSHPHHHTLSDISTGCDLLKYALHFLHPYWSDDKMSSFAPPSCKYVYRRVAIRHHEEGKRSSNRNERVRNQDHVTMQILCDGILLSDCIRIKQHGLHRPEARQKPLFYWLHTTKYPLGARKCTPRSSLVQIVYRNHQL